MPTMRRLAFAGAASCCIRIGTKTLNVRRARGDEHFVPTASANALPDDGLERAPDPVTVRARFGARMLWIGGLLSELWRSAKAEVADLEQPRRLSEEATTGAGRPISIEHIVVVEHLGAGRLQQADEFRYHLPAHARQAMAPIMVPVARHSVGHTLAGESSLQVRTSSRWSHGRSATTPGPG